MLNALQNRLGKQEHSGFVRAVVAVNLEREESDWVEERKPTSRGEGALGEEGDGGAPESVEEVEETLE